MSTQGIEGIRPQEPTIPAQTPAITPAKVRYLQTNPSLENRRIVEKGIDSINVRQNRFQLLSILAGALAVVGGLALAFSPIGVGLGILGVAVICLGLAFQQFQSRKGEIQALNKTGLAEMKDDSREQLKEGAKLFTLGAGIAIIEFFSLVFAQEFIGLDAFTTSMAMIAPLGLIPEKNINEEEEQKEMTLEQAQKNVEDAAQRTKEARKKVVEEVSAYGEVDPELVSNLRTAEDDLHNAEQTLRSLQ